MLLHQTLFLADIDSQQLPSTGKYWQPIRDIMTFFMLEQASLINLFGISAFFSKVYMSTKVNKHTILNVTY